MHWPLACKLAGSRYSPWPVAPSEINKSRLLHFMHWPLVAKLVGPHHGLWPVAPSAVRQTRLILCRQM